MADDGFAKQSLMDGTCICLSVNLSPTSGNQPQITIYHNKQLFLLQFLLFCQSLMSLFNKQARSFKTDSCLYLLNFHKEDVTRRFVAGMANAKAKETTHSLTY